MSLLPEDVDVIENSALFDGPAYMRQFPDVALSKMSAAEHYLKIGGAIGRNPSSEFDSAAYLSTYLDVAARGENPLLHFERHGRNEGRSPLPDAPQAPDETDGTVDIVIPVFNALEDVKNCLAAVAAAPNTHRFRVLVVNDGSDPATSQWLRTACDELSTETTPFVLIEHPENRGYTQAVNTGLKETNAAFVVTLNSDTIVTAHWLDGLIQCMQSDPRLGIVGPMSNAASWQNVPTLYAQDKTFAINPLPKGTSPDDMADIVRKASARSYPRSPFVNGFCFMVRRAVLDAVGYMDSAAFPVAYGEENDFSIRAQDAGFALAFADDVYVYHAKSKSFGQEQRVALSQQGIEALKSKHGSEKFATLLERVSRTAQMDKVRHNIRAALSDGTANPAESARKLITAQRILFILPVRGGGGGAHSVVQEVAAMRDLGVQAKIAVHDGDLVDYLRLYSDIEDVQNLFTAFSPNSLAFVAGGYDIVVATIYSSVEMLAQVIDQMPWIMPAYYAQDYEPFFYEEGENAWQEAADSYQRIPGMFIFAKTSWICDTITQRHSVQVHKVEPSLDHRVYGLNGPRIAQPDGTICITAMIRPNTPRRGASRTMALLAKIKAQFGAQVTIRLFGSATSEPEFQALQHDFDFVNHGILSRPKVAELLRSSDIFIDLSDYQAFGRTGLEAMACGALAVVPMAGGASEYAVDDVNALIVDTFDVDACFARICDLLGDREKLERTQLNGIETASRYSPRRAAIKELSAFAPALSAWRRAHPRPLDRARLLLLPDTLTPGASALPGLGNERLPRPYQQAEFLGRWDVITVPDKALNKCKRGDIAILQGNARARFGTRFDSWLNIWKQDGGRIIYDLNGDVQQPAEVDLTLAAAADVITVSNPAQRAELLFKLPMAALKVMDVPTYLDGAYWRLAAPEVPENNPLQIGYFGSPDNRDDLASINPALDAVEQKHGVEIKILGPYQKLQPQVGERVNYLKRQIEPNFKQTEFIQWLSKASRWDIVVLPDAGPIRQKFWQVCAMQGAVVCRDAPDLRGIANHEQNCLLVDDDPANWADALTRLINDQTLRRSLARAARKEARQNWTQKANSELYKTVLEKAINGF